MQLHIPQKIRRSGKDYRNSWFLGRSLHHWKNSNITEDEMLSAISKTEVIPVLTAHPTEAKGLL